MKLTNQSASEIYEAACLPGASGESAALTIDGSIWLKIQSDELKGQFPATVQAEKSSSKEAITIWINNPFGGTEAKISVSNGDYQVFDSEGRIKGEGKESWNGIPVGWATGLFFGRVPCPPPSKLPHELKIQGDTLVILPFRSKDESFVFTFKKVGEKPWPETLKWEKGKHTLEFKFESPDSATLSPKKWEARSKDGLIRVVWRSRHVN